MQTLIITFILLLLVVIGMAVGVLMGRKPLKGSCGGVGAALGEKDYTCELCGGDEEKCEEEQLKQAGENNVGENKEAGAKPAADLSYDATADKK